MTDFEINGKIYRIGALTGRQQFHVARRLAPAIWALFSVVSQDEAPITAAKIQTTIDALEDLGVLKPVAECIANMSDADSDYIIDTCLSVVTREASGQWAKVWIPGSGSMFGSDMNLQVIMKLVIAVIKENMGNFSDALQMPS